MGRPTTSAPAISEPQKKMSPRIKTVASPTVTTFSLRGAA